MKKQVLRKSSVDQNIDRKNKTEKSKLSEIRIIGEKPEMIKIVSFSEQSSNRQSTRNGVTPMDAVTASQHIGTEAHENEIAE